jgi:endonuclease III
MKLFDSELQYLSELYRRLHSELSTQSGKSISEDATALVEAILSNRELLSRVDQMNVRLYQLVKDWEAFREHMGPEARTSIKSLAGSVQRQATELSQLVETRSRELGQARTRLEEALGELQKGTRYLASVKPIQANYPKFIDSHG